MASAEVYELLSDDDVQSDSGSYQSLSSRQSNRSETRLSKRASNGRVKAAYGGTKSKKIVYKEGFCMFCFTDSTDEMQCGEILTKDGVTVHNHCLLSASNLTQSGEEDIGLQGFLVDDIRKELNRAGHLSCSFCKKKGAAIGCGIETCKFKYHFNCGLNNECFFLFFDDFTSYCKQHRPRQNPIVQNCKFMTFRVTVNASCLCCLDSVASEASDNVIRTNCCRTLNGKEKFQYYHRDCLRSLAIKSGIHHLRCPQCKDTGSFIKILRDCGIYVPDRDAQWESEPNAFVDQNRYGKCIRRRELCLCPQGFDYDDHDIYNDWCLIFCCCCGADSSAIHRKCLGVGPDDCTTDWLCPECEDFEKRREAGFYQPGEADVIMRTPTPPPRGRKRVAESPLVSERSVRRLNLNEMRYRSPTASNK